MGARFVAGPNGPFWNGSRPLMERSPALVSWLQIGVGPVEEVCCARLVRRIEMNVPVSLTSALGTGRTANRRPLDRCVICDRTFTSAAYRHFWAPSHPLRDDLCEGRP